VLQCDARDAERSNIVKRTIEFLDSSGHLALEWDASDPKSVARAQAEFDELQAAGYTFFRAVEVIAFDASDGKLEVRRVAADEVRPRVMQPIEPAVRDEASRRRGRPPGSRNHARASDEGRVVAARPMRGG
jgi:hypothetical protein